MFARWLFVRLNAAERALREGRIDDVCRALDQADLREHARGQRLLDDLIKPLVARARLHRQAGRYSDALADLDRLEVLGRTTPDVQTLRQQLAEEMRRNVAQAAEQQAAYGRAAEHLQAGRLESLRLNLGRVDDTKQREALAGELDVRVRRGSQLLQQASDALERKDVLAAVRFWQDACQRHGRTRETDEFTVRLGAEFRASVERWCAEGKMDQLMAARSGLAALLPLEPGLTECERIVTLCHRAMDQLSAIDYGALRQTLLRLKAACGETEWLSAALEAVENITRAQDTLLAGPLGLCASRAAARPDYTPRETSAVAAPAQERLAHDAIRLDRPLLVLVDGGGSSLLVASDRVRIGRGGHATPVDVPLPADVQSHHADILRRGEDYFLAAYGPTTINGRSATQALLRDGDRITLGTGAKLVFSKPSSKSESAVLRLSHRCRLPQDVGEIIIFKQTCLIGPSPTCHVKTHDGLGQVVLFERGNALHGRQVAGANWQDATTRALLAGQTLEFGDVRVTVKVYNPGTEL